MSLFIKAKQAGQRYVKPAKKLAMGAVSALAIVTPAFAETAQPDVAEVVAYMLASIVTISLIGNASLVVRTSLRVFGWMRSAIR